MHLGMLSIKHIDEQNIGNVFTERLQTFFYIYHNLPFLTFKSFLFRSFYISAQHHAA